MQAACDADPDAVPHVSDLVVPMTSLACPPDALEAHGEAVAFKTESETVNTFNDWLAHELEPCCAELAAAYNGLIAMEQ